MYLLDTNVVSELRRAKKADPRVRAWAQTLPAANLYLSVISILELEMGVLLMERRDRKQGRILRAWMDGHVLPRFAGRVLRDDGLQQRHSATAEELHCDRHCYVGNRFCAAHHKC